jgi:hypothetical protein
MEKLVDEKLLGERWWSGVQNGMHLACGIVVRRSLWRLLEKIGIKVDMCRLGCVVVRDILRARWW